jgi:hypothetical protein
MSHLQENFLKRDNGNRVNSFTGQSYLQYNLIGYTLFKVLQSAMMNRVNEKLDSARDDLT